MEHWARGPLGRGVDFLCICVDTLQTAQTFQRLFQFQGCVNGWIPSPQAMPSFGQLGCSGFVVLDGKGGCASRKTQAFLQHGEAAFAALEALLSKLLPAAPTAAASAAASAAAAQANGYAPGSTLLLEGLKSDPSLNGARVRVLGFDTASGRFSVALEADAARVLAVRPCSLAPAPPLQAASEGGAALRAIPTPAATGCRSIDLEHEQCTAALNALLAAPSSASALAAALAALAAHFQHEEAVLQQHKFGGSTLGGGSEGRGFSAASGHAEDHARILALGQQELARLAGAAAGSECRESVSWQLASAFNAHARDFDALFEGKVPEDA
jgi:hypothetical protein